VDLQNPDIPQISQHDLILGGVEWLQNKDGKQHYYPRSVFEKRLSTFDDLKIIYAKKHPPQGLYGKNIEDVLKAIDGKVVGYTKNSILNNTGSDFLKTTGYITDPETEQKIKKRELMISSGFRYKAPDVGYLEDVIGDHVLFYDKASGIPQGDPKALILNQGSPDDECIGYLAGNFGACKMTDEPKSELAELVTLIKNNMGEANEKFLIQETEKLKLNADIAAVNDKMSQMQTAIDERDAKITELQTIIDDMKKNASQDKTNRIKGNQDAWWNNLIKPVQEKFLARKEESNDDELKWKLNQDIDAFIANIPKPELKNAEGATEIKGNTSDENSYDSINAEFKAKMGMS